MPTDPIAAAFRDVYQWIVEQTPALPEQVPAVGLTPTPPRRPRWGLLAATAVVVVLVGVAIFRSPGPVAESDGLAGFRAHTRPSEGGMAAIVTGVLEIDVPTGCVWLTDPSGARDPVMWPLGTRAQTDPPAIVLPDGQVVRSGDRVEGGGGYVDALAPTSAAGLDPFPAECVSVGEAAVFNADSEMTVTPGVGLDMPDTLVTRFSPPQPIGLELIAVNPNARSMAVADFVTATVHLYGRDDYQAPTDAIDGASGGGGFTNLWANGTIWTYWPPMSNEPLVYQPEPRPETAGIAATLEVLPAPDGQHQWLVQPGVPDGPTLIELVDLVDFEVGRIMTTEVEGDWRPMGATAEGLVLNDGDSQSQTLLVAPDGTASEGIDGHVLSVGWLGAAMLQDDGSLVVTDGLLGNSVSVEKPGEGGWVDVGGPMIPATSPPLRTGAESYLVMLANEPGKGPISSGSLAVVDPDGTARVVYELSEGSHLASWSRGLDWVVVVENSFVTLISLADGSTYPLGDLIPDEHWVLTAG
jgi:hypothetical protein